MHKAVFLDRDGVINEVCYDDDRGIYSPVSLEEFKILHGVKEAIKALKDRGFIVVVVSNQPGIAFGHLKKAILHQIDLKMKDELAIDGIYYCFHHPKVTGECNCRKPKPGLLQQAMIDFNIDMARSYMVGDNLSDIEAGAGCKKTILIGHQRCDVCTLAARKNIKPDYIVADLQSAVQVISTLDANEDE
ncbi:MAG: HAD family hydrolase [Candidatus Lokiarchaeota archaeon]|nr:HAD family hydrolase [Candidatus Lokiarchaeota archaeon]